VKKAIRDHMRDFVAIGGLLFLGLLVTGVILSQQRVTLPGWFPVLGQDRFEMEIEMSSAQAVIPGQGQTVNLAGIKVGDVTGVEVEDGKAVVSVSLQADKAELIHEDATVLLRPRTGLQDMTLEVDPGTEEAPVVEEGARISSDSTAPNVQPDEILAALDRDTQDYLKLLIAGGGEGLGGNGEELSAGLRRIEPFARNIARINRLLVARRENIKRAVTNFKLVSEELGARDTQLAEFVDSSNAVMDSFANQEANLRASLQELPGALTETRAALASGDRLAQTLGPASTALIPSARALGPALEATRPFLEETRAPIRDQIRPFTRATQTPLRHIAQGAEPLAQTTKGLRGGIGNLNKLLNALAFNPAGTEEGYLFWLSWLNHNQNNMFYTQDANGPLRRGIVLQSCQTAQLAEGLAASRPFLRTLQQVTNVPDSTTICPLTPPP
jgi:phospholipid/cholesterol/gamma-HCH transport system substrate-binding protein